MRLYRQRSKQKLRLVHQKFLLGYIRFNDTEFYAKWKECIEEIRLSCYAPWRQEILIRVWKQITSTFFEVIFIRI